MTARDRITIGAFSASVVALFLERGLTWPPIGLVIHFLDASILFLILWETFLELRDAKYRWNYVRSNAFSLAFIACFTALFLYSKYMTFFGSGTRIGALPEILRNIFLVLKIAGRFRKLFKLAERFALKPAQTIAISFLLVILAGALILMMPFSTRDGAGLSFLNAAFTATSAVCVTGLVVVDTATDLSRMGQAMVLVLIQIGGLGIMAFSFFAMFALRKKVSVQDSLTVSYMLGEEDMSNLSRGLKTIVLTTLGIEALGALALFARLAMVMDSPAEAGYYAIFHAISAFCNAGFALYSDSLESFRGDPAITLSVATLIVVGGLSFGVLKDARRWMVAAIRRVIRRGEAPKVIASVNSRVVLTWTFALLGASFFGFYLLEHGGVMAKYGLGEQYLSAFFQAVTLRTAGFNSVPFGSLRDGTLLFMTFFMFVGGASGGTAGGIKINSLAAMGAYFLSFIRQEKTIRIGTSSIAPEKVGKALLILLFGLVAVFTGSFVLSLSEEVPFQDLLFEVVSAFGTVGLSVGVTPHLTTVGKLSIMILMFLGRLGPLTILSAASSGKERGAAEYPPGDLAIG